MPKHSFPAAAEGMPIFNRRSILSGIAVAPAVALPAADVAAPEQEALEPKGHSPEQVERLMEAAYLYGCLPPDQKKMALAQLKELMRQRRELI